MYFHNRPNYGLTAINPCQTNQCLNGGTCQPTPGDCTQFSCLCEGCYTGERCEIRKYRDGTFFINVESNKDESGLVGKFGLKDIAYLKGANVD